jgi:uncharacterized membrane protein
MYVTWAIFAVVGAILIAFRKNFDPYYFDGHIFSDFVITVFSVILIYALFIFYYQWKHDIELIY